MMTSLPITKHPPAYASASAAEAATKLKMFQFTCIGPFMHSCAHFEGMLPKKKYPAAQLRASSSVRYDSSVSAHKIMSET